jgi:phage tail P2-like protein
MRKHPLTLLPPNSTQLEYDLESVMLELADLSVDFHHLWNPDLCPKEFLPWLAWALSVDIWRSWWPEQIQRDIIKESMIIHWKKGTPWAVRRLLELAGTPDIDIVEWWQKEPRGIPYTFCIHIRSNPSFNPYQLDQEQYSTIRRLIDTTKPVRADYCLRVEAGLGNIEIDEGEEKKNHGLGLANTTSVITLPKESRVVLTSSPQFRKDWGITTTFSPDLISRRLLEPVREALFDPCGLTIGTTFSSDAISHVSMDAVPTLEFDADPLQLGSSCCPTSVTHRSMDAEPTLEFDADPLQLGSSTRAFSYTRLEAKPQAQNDDFFINYGVFTQFDSKSLLRMSVSL